MATEVPREKLKELIEKNGDSLFQDRDRCEGLLKDYCGGHRREISAIVGALEERIPVELKSSWQTAMTPEAMRARLVQRLEDNRGLAPEIANYAVDTWSYALGVGLGRSSDRVQDVPVARKMVWHRSHRRPKERQRIGRQAQPRPAPRRRSRPGQNGRFHRRSEQSEQGHRGGRGATGGRSHSICGSAPSPARGSPECQYPGYAERPELTKHAAHGQMDKMAKTHTPRTHRLSRAVELVQARRPARADSWQRTSG